MIQTLEENSDFSWRRVFGMLTKLAILGALIYAGKYTYNTIAKDTPEFGSRLGPGRITNMTHSVDR
ncbi:MAG: hypothetical protein IJV07_02685 [Alphaproteobacteria bacterium]|nr:hypothetical protein [Alphaproteobacteria bacterium]